MQSLRYERRQAKRARRRQVRRRRIVAILVVVPIIVSATWVAYAWPSTAPALVPAPNVVSPFDQPGAVNQRVVVARLDGIDLLLPTDLNTTTAVAFHPVDQPNSLALVPVGRQGDPSGVGSALAEIFASGGMRYYTMGGDSQDASPPTAGLDVGAVPGATVYAPVDGQVVAVTDYQLLGRYPDTEIDIQLADDSGIVLTITHIADPQVAIGDAVTAGQTALGTVRGFPPQLHQDLRQFTNDNGDHVQLVAEQVPIPPSGS